MLSRPKRPGRRLRIPSTAEVNNHPNYELIFHSIAATHFLFATWYDWFYCNMPAWISPIIPAYGYKLKFFTNWNAYIETFYFCLAVFLDLARESDVIKKTENHEEKCKLIRLKQHLQACVVLPLSMYVCFIYWLAMITDPEMLMPHSHEAYVPPWLSWMLHTNSVVFPVLELFLCDISWPSQTNCKVSIVWIIQLAYIIWNEFLHTKSGVWPYPIFNKITDCQRFGLYCSSFVVSFYFFGLAHRTYYRIKNFFSCQGLSDTDEIDVVYIRHREGCHCR